MHTPATGPTTPSISGTVTAAAGATPLAGVTVRVYAVGSGYGGPPPSVATTTTSASGAYTVNSGLVAYQSYAVCFDATTVTTAGAPATGYATTCASQLALTATQQVTGVNAALTVGGAITGTVTDNAAHRLAGVKVTVYVGYGIQLTATTTSTGTYRLASVPAATYDVCFDESHATGGIASGYAQFDCVDNVTVTAGATTRTVNEKATAAGAFSGTVTDTSGHPLAGVTVSVQDNYGRGSGLAATGATPARSSTKAQVQLAHPNATGYATATTSADGTYTVIGLSAGYYDVCFDGTGATGATSTTGYQDACYAPGNVQITASATRTAINAALTPGGAISGMVLGTGSKPLAGADVQVDYLSIGITTAANGTYSAQGIAPGQHTVCFVATGFTTSCYSNAAPPAPPTPVTVTVSSTAANVNGTLTAVGSAAVGSVSGKVTTGGVAVPNVLVEAESDTGYGHATTASDGTYKIVNLPVGSYTVCFYPQSETSTLVYQCWKLKAPRSTPTPVAVTAGGNTSGISGALTTGGAISGTLTGPGATAVAGADVSVSAGSTNTGGDDSYGDATTAADGTFTVSGLPAGTYTVCFFPPDARTAATAPGLAPGCHSGSVTVKLGATTTGVNATLSPAGAVSGTVTDTSGATVANVGVYVQTGSGSFDTSTAADGTYLVGNLSPGTYTVCFNTQDVVTTYGYVGQCYNGVTGNRGTPVTVGAGSTVTGINAVLTIGGVVTGTVRDSAGHVLGGAEADVYSNSGGTSVYTSDRGTFSASGLAPGRYTVCVEGGTGGASDAAGYLGICTTTSVTVTSGHSISAGVITLRAGGGISGQVTSAAGSPISDVQVTVDIDNDNGAKLYDYTGSDGRYDLNGLDAGTYDVCFTPGQYSNPYGLAAPATGYLPQCNSVTVTAGAVATANAVLGSGAAVSGTVTDSSGHPLQNVDVEVTQSGQSSEASTGADGTYTVVSLGAGAATVCFDGEQAIGGSADSYGYSPQCWKNKGSGHTPTPVTLTAGSTTNGINAALVAAGTITGKVTDSSGHAVAGVQVTVDPSGDSFDTVTSSDGTYAITGLVPGRYTVCFDPSSTMSTYGYQAQCWKQVATGGVPTPVTVTGGATTTGINAALVSAGIISGTVTDTAGHPLAGVSVQITDGAGDYLSTTTSSTGVYLMSGVAPGTATVCFFADGGGVTGGIGDAYGYLDQCWKKQPVNNGNPTPVTVTAGHRTSSISAQLGADGGISGTVTDSAGHALAGVTVTVNDSAYDEQQAQTSADGTYRVIGVAPGSTTVCFDGSVATGGSSSTGYAGQCWNNQPVSGNPTPVTVTGGATSGSINAALVTGGAISGTITNSGKHGLAAVDVQVYQDGSSLLDTQTASDGSYTVKGLGTGTYTVCFSAGNVQDATHPAGYLDRCWKNKADEPYSATPVSVTAGATTAAISLALPAAGGISGTVTTVGGDSLSYVSYNLTGSDLNQGGSMIVNNGAYLIGQLPAGSYTICFQPYYEDQQYAQACYSTASDGSPTPVTVTAGKVTSGINAVLPLAGAIAGTVTDTSGNPLDDIEVDVTGGPGGNQTSADTNAQGQYDATGLAPGSYTVCFTLPYGSDSPTGYLPDCYNQTTQASATTVTVTSGTTTTGIDASLTPGGGISGTVTDADGNPVSTVEVDVYIDGADSNTVAYADTDDSGSYSLNSLPSGSYDVCFNDYSGTYGYQCYDDVTDFSAPTPVAVTAGSVTTGIDATLVAPQNMARRRS